MTGGGDVGPVPVDAQYPLSGIHANVLNTILTANYLRELSPVTMLWAVEIPLLALIVLLALRFCVYGGTINPSGKAGEGNRQNDLWMFAIRRLDQITKLSAAIGPIPGCKGPLLLSYLATADYGWDLAKPFYTAKRNPTISFSVYRDLDEEVADFAAQTGKTFALQMGSQPGKMIAMVMPNALITTFPAPTNLDGMVGTTVTIEAGNYTGDNDAAADTSPVNTNFRIAFI